MELEEALKRIEELEGEISKATDTQKTAIKEALDLASKESEKALQVSYNKGFDKAKNASEDEKKNGYISKEEVDKLLAERDTTFNRQSALKDLGIKNPKKAMKLIDDDDLASLGTEDFKAEDFKKKYGEDIVFISGNSEEDTKQFSSNHTKNNDEQKSALTAEKFEQMTAEERGKLSTADKLALL